MSNFSMISLMTQMIHAMFYDMFPQKEGRRGLTFAEDMWTADGGHHKGLVVSFRSYPKGKSLNLLIYSSGTYPLVAAAWSDIWANPDKIRDWQFLSRHDASVSESVKTVLKAVDKLNISSFDGYANGISVHEFSTEAREYIKTLTYENSRSAYKTIDDYLLGKHLSDLED